MNFLKQIAEIYCQQERDNLIDYCFVFPNKRSGIFFSKHISDIFSENKLIGIMPKVTTISDFIYDFNSTTEASRTELLFILYNIYSDILTKTLTAQEIKDGLNLIDFNKFIFWADMLINDFNDVDKYLVDPAQIFKNIHDLKEISSNFLSKEHLEIISRYWKEAELRKEEKDFWRHITSNGAKFENDSSDSERQTAAGFVKLWQVMFLIYTNFRKKLEETGISYSGMAYREAVDRINEMSPEQFQFKRYIFIGFSTLSAAEKKIFNLLKKYRLADFYWDYSSPAFKIEGNPASKFISKLVAEFPSIYELQENAEEFTYPHFDIFTLPSTTSQAKILPSIIKTIHPELFNDKEPHGSIMDTAVILPDEALAVPLVHSIPKQIEDVNFTMGFPLKLSQIASLLKNIISLQLRARKLSEEYTFYYEDVIAVLSHPIIRKVAGETANAITRMINEQRMFNISLSELSKEIYSPLHPLFCFVENVNEPIKVFEYLDNLLNWLLYAVKQFNKLNEENANNEDKIIESSPTLEIGFIRSYQEALSKLKDLFDNHINIKDIFIEDKTIFHLVERTVGNLTVNFKGMPLKGLQIMGLLESRALDFDNIIITSMNERVFPRKLHSKSFIPNMIRKGYGMATIEDQESMFAYYFYRLISRAKRVYLLYDSRTTGLKSGDASRFINQLKYIVPKENITYHNGSFTLSSFDKYKIKVEKSSEVMSRLNLFRTENPATQRFLSASSINEYINCPLKFYLSTVEKFYQEDEIKNYMDEGTYGTIIHEIVENIYKEAQGNPPKPFEVKHSWLEKLKNPKTTIIDKFIERAIKKHYLKQPENSNEPLYGDSEIFFKIMKRTIMLMFEREQQLPPFYFLQGEMKQNVRMPITKDLTINFTFRIDRVDKTYDENGREIIRLIDYKTGGDEIKASSIESLFKETSSGKRPKAILQLLLYANAFAIDKKYEGAIQPFIYQLRTIAVESLSTIKINKNDIIDYHEVNEEFMDNLGKVLTEMFDPNIPFEAKPSQSACKYCQFKELCDY